MVPALRLADLLAWQGRLANDCMGWALFMGLLGIESWGMLAHVHPLTTLMRTAVHYMGPVWHAAASLMKELGRRTGQAMGWCVKHLWRLLTWCVLRSQWTGKWVGTACCLLTNKAAGSALEG